MTRRLWPRGLRARLLAAFALVTVLGAAAAAWSSAGSASTALVTSTEQRLTETVVGQIAPIAPQLTYPPDQGALDRLRAAVGANALVTYQDLRSADGAGPELVTDALRTAVRVQNRLVTQRIIAEGRPWLLVGTPIVITAVDGARIPSGIEVYTARDLTDVDQQIDALAWQAVITAALALPLAVLLAVLAAGSVLRPVRELRDTARRLADGELDARTSPQGADELAELTVTVNEMAESVQTSMAAMQRMQADAKRFAADVSHELRTPLTTLTAVVEVLATTADGMDADARESAQLAITETHRLVQLVEDLMEVSRFDAGTAHLRVEEIDVVGAVRDCLRARGWLERVDLVAPDEVLLRADRRRLDVIVANLVGNALRHGEPPVRVRISASCEQARIEVTDAGPGLPESALPHVFDRFYKADAARTRTPGSGLGLAIALENARLHGGDLSAGNADGGGARFVLRLPRDLEEL
ncbi:two-component system, OmpR family, sensor histidine kinase MtrB [Saccharopolyspora kobensis]|uniref:histidine kinase n=2 Tax=Saccharopolyspora kobensis TaxID=146035 RepID=A0A1H5VAR7_9PSEU|nr:HAMP domain-containing sensor histidine kinase [Saccharopolyspora kobensis]SEF84482.1 two-component system, OmpR family, sensor histidine kinase MtrB [Saccharopolyspora kobensis]SFC63005.1 two-component system, OmpR family, sensor histidine kinase MtrB [Saccharopolyspora kobensis]